ncbi:TPA: hypothetical protein OCP62_004393 [Escherichia coli]|nr:hypothetical protein [Escherichia coli]
MTNNEYEKLSVEAATGESEIAWIDAHIEHHLRQVDNLMERRRELINRFNLNKGGPMPKITIASLERRIMVLESEKQTLGGQLSINGEFQLEAFKLLLDKLRADEKPCAHDYYLHVVGGLHRVTCIKCGEAYGVA